MASNALKETPHVKGMYREYFLDYASYVIQDRAVPYLEDGLKPVQRRLLHALRELEDGRFHKAANVIGSTMKFHPHGDAAIRDALVNLAQKNLLIDTQGNWGDPVTGDAAAAPRYVECKLSPFALEVAFNPKTTQWHPSYDGRNREPVVLPMKFPLLLAQGAEGIAVGLSTRILPHNFAELLEACVKILKKEAFTLVPDFPTGGYMDASEYDDGRWGGKVKVRAKIEIGKKRNLVIREIPYGTTTASLMDSIVAANDKGKIKIKRIEDNTAQQVEIMVHLPPGADAQKSMDALFAFTDCEVALSPNCCVIRDRRPVFTGVGDMLRTNVGDTVALLKAELEIRLGELEERWHLRNLESLFIEERIYRKIEKCETWASIVDTIRGGLKPFAEKLKRPVTDADIEHLVAIRIRRITAFDAKRAREELVALEKAMAETRKNLRRLTRYAIGYFEDLLKRYGQGRGRKTRIREFRAIERSEVILSNLRVGFDRKSGFIGTGVKGDDHVPNCSALDDLIVFTEDGHFTITKVSEKTYVGKGILRAARFDRGGEEVVYHYAYRDGRSGPVLVKRFSIGGVTRDKQYSLTRGTQHSRVLYLAAVGRGAREVVEVKHAPKPRIKKSFPFEFSSLEVKSRGARGNILTKHGVRSIRRVKLEGPSQDAAPAGTPGEPPDSREAGKRRQTPAPESRKAAGPTRPENPAPASGASGPSGGPTLAAGGKTTGAPGIPVFWNPSKGMIGHSVHGRDMGRFEGGDSVILFYDDGSYITYTAREELETGEGVLYAGKWDPRRAYSAVYTDGDSGHLFGKRFRVPSPTAGKYFFFISEYEDSRLHYFSAHPAPEIEIVLKPVKGSRDNALQVHLTDQGFPVHKPGHRGSCITKRRVKSVVDRSRSQLSML